MDHGVGWIGRALECGSGARGRHGPWGTLQWLFAALADRAFTFGYFIPTMVGLMSAADSPQAVATATRWATLNYVRLAIVLAAWLAALEAFAVFYQQRE